MVLEEFTLLQMARCSNPVMNDYLYAVYDNLSVSNIKVFRSYKKSLGLLQ